MNGSDALLREADVRLLADAILGGTSYAPHREAAERVRAALDATNEPEPLDDPLTAEELLVLPRMRLDVDRVDAFRSDDVRVLLDIIDRLDRAYRSARYGISA